MRTDADIQKDILAQLKWEPFLNAAEIGVSVKSGVATLNGIVDSYFTKIAVEQAAKKIAGVKAVAEEIQVGPTLSNQKTDTELAQAITNALRWHTAVQEDKIKIKVEKGVVTLDGTVDWNFQRTAAFDSIKNLTGIQRINNYIVVKSGSTSADVKQKIKASIQRHATMDSDKVSVEIVGNKAILRGTVRSFAEREDAEFAAWSAPGITNVENKLMIEEPELVF